MSSASWTDDAASAAALLGARRSAVGQLPSRSAALYARWWQLETWIRELAYVELRALNGVKWADSARVAATRQAADQQYRHLEGADNSNVLAHFDYSQLLQVVEAHWDQIGDSLMHRGAWDAHQVNLQRIRHRIAHLRRSHPDDLARVEQVLQDLEDGAFNALSTYNIRSIPKGVDDADAVAVGWLAGDHDDARRLINHAARQYDTRLILRKSRRPWCTYDIDIPTQAGQFWHLEFKMRDRTVDARSLWRDDYVESIRPLIVHMLAESPWHVSFTFSALDDGVAVADAFGRIFEAVLTNSRPGFIDEAEFDEWREQAGASPDFRLLHETGWNEVDESLLPMSLFRAGARTEQARRTRYRKS